MICHDLRLFLQVLHCLHSSCGRCLEEILKKGRGRDIDRPTWGFRSLTLPYKPTYSMARPWEERRGEERFPGQEALCPVCGHRIKEQDYHKRLASELRSRHVLPHCALFRSISFLVFCSVLLKVPLQLCRKPDAGLCSRQAGGGRQAWQAAAQPNNGLQWTNYMSMGTLPILKCTAHVPPVLVQGSSPATSVWMLFQQCSTAPSACAGTRATQRTSAFDNCLRLSVPPCNPFWYLFYGSIRGVDNII